MIDVDLGALLDGLTDPPKDPTALRVWVDERAVELGALMARVAGELARTAATRYAESLTAAGDVAAFDGLDAVWRSFVTEVVGEYSAGMYLSGSLNAWVAAAGRDVPPEMAARWASVVNENAVAYQASATNRIVGASTDLWADVQGRVVSALQSGMSNDDLKRSIEDVTGYSEYRADTIGRTETIRAYNGGDLTGAKALGEYGPSHKRWLAALDARTRPEHAEADGQTVGLNENFVVMGEEIGAPGEGSAANVVNCRCVMELLYPEDLTDAERAAAAP